MYRNKTYNCRTNLKILHKYLLLLSSNIVSMVAPCAQTDFDHCKITANMAKITLRFSIDDEIKDEFAVSAMII